MVGLCWLVLSLSFLIAAGLIFRALPALEQQNFTSLLFSAEWRPSSGHFGLAAFIIGTVWVTGIAIILAVPLGILTAIYLAEYAPRPLHRFVRPLIDLLAGISPVIFGVFGLLAIVPFIRDILMPFSQRWLPFFPFLSDNYTGFSALSAGIVLAIMVLPIIISVVEEVLESVPVEIREAALSLGATKWEAVKLAVLRKAQPGIIAAVILGLSRAFGETMAVLMVAGCSMHTLPRSLFDTAYPLPALIANTYGEMMSIPLYDAAILFAALVLLLITAAFNMVGWGILIKNIRSEA
jgi:phosphate transport system permease protein